MEFFYFFNSTFYSLSVTFLGFDINIVQSPSPIATFFNLSLNPVCIVLLDLCNEINKVRKLKEDCRDPE